MRITGNILLYIFLLIMCAQQHAFAQCGTTINAFPYNEGFEVNNGNWTPGSLLHWEWGTPFSKTVVTAAGGGTRAWIAGGLSGSSYSSGSSELVSPCFNFSTLANPEISFKVFWETELKYDGATLMYSTDGGSNWLVLGAENSNDPCLDIENWFNYSPVNFLGGLPGWSGNVQSGGGSCQYGQGSGQWLTAKHNLAVLAGAPAVIFKFVFGAGTICNAFDGFAIDDIHIGEIPANTAGFSFSCGPNNSVQFTNNAMACQTGWLWDFGDPVSTDNISTDENPTHVFSSPGSYIINLTVNYASGPPAIVSPKNITIPGVTTINTNIKCNGEQNGAIRVNVSPPGVYNYTWNTNPVQSGPSISNLAANIPYTVTVSSATTCSVSVPVILTEPSILITSPLASPAKCGNNNGSVSANASGGTAPYFYTWSNGQNTAVINNLAAGMYNLAVKDANGCIAPTVNNIEIKAVTNNLNVFLGRDTTICPGQTLLLNPGSFAQYKWQDNTTHSSYAVTKTGSYAVLVTDNDGCSGSDSIKVTVDCRGIYFPSAFTPGTDPLNPSFGAVGDLGSIKAYNLTIYNRYGQIIFATADPYKKWDGIFKGKALDTQNFVWTATYTLTGRSAVFAKGTVMIIR